MSKRELPPDLRATMKLFGEAQLERIEAMSREELDEAMRAHGLDPNAPFDIEEMLAKLPPEEDQAAPLPAAPSDAPAGVGPSRVLSPGASVTPLVPKENARHRVSPLLWIALPAAAAVLVAIRLPKGPDSGIVARAAELRSDAAQLCQEQRWSECAQSLDQARALDPAGESEEAVVTLREAIARAEQPREHEPPPPPGREFKPRLEVKPPIPPRRP